MKMNLSEQMAYDLFRTIVLKSTLAVGDSHPGTIEDLLTIAECMSAIANKLTEVASEVEGKVEDAHLRRGVNILGVELNAEAIEYNRTVGGRPWVATVSCECDAEEFCDKCGVNTESEINECVEKFMNN